MPSPDSPFAPSVLSISFCLLGQKIHLHVHFQPLHTLTSCRTLLRFNISFSSFFFCISCYLPKLFRVFLPVTFQIKSFRLIRPCSRQPVYLTNFLLFIKVLTHMTSLWQTTLCPCFLLSLTEQLVLPGRRKMQFLLIWTLKTLPYLADELICLGLAVNVPLSHNI